MLYRKLRSDNVVSFVGLSAAHVVQSCAAAQHSKASVLKGQFDRRGKCSSPFSGRGCLTPIDVIHITAAPGITPWNGSGKLDGAVNIAFKIYRVTEGDGPSTVFVATRNFTYGSPLSATQAPYQEKGFVVVQMGGDALALNQRQATTVQLIGLLPGRQNLLDRPVEQPDDALIQK